LTLSWFCEGTFLVAICPFISSVFFLLFVIILFFWTLHQFEWAGEELELKDFFHAHDFNQVVIFVKSVRRAEHVTLWMQLLYNLHPFWHDLGRKVCAIFYFCFNASCCTTMSLFLLKTCVS
jgi:hypothetical protein